QDGLKRIRDIIADLRSFAYGGPATAEAECDPVKIVRTAKRLLAAEIKDDVVLEEKVNPGVLVYGNENQLVQLVVNILQNALQATEKNAASGKLRIVKIRIEAESNYFSLSVW